MTTIPCTATELRPGVMLNGLDDPHVILSVTETGGYTTSHSTTRWATGLILAASTTLDTHHRFAVWNTYYKAGAGWFLERGDYLPGALDDAVYTYGERGGNPGNHLPLGPRSLVETGR